MAHTISNGILTTSGIIDADDWNSIVNKYNTEIGLQFSYKTSNNDIITASDWNSLLEAIKNTANGRFIIEQLPSTFVAGSIITSTSWGGSIAINYPEVELTSPGDYTYTVPAGIHNLYIYNLIAGGGAGGCGWNQELGETGGGGGSGGYISDTTVTVNPGDTIMFRIGAGGENTKIYQSNGNTTVDIKYIEKPTDGSNSELYINSNIIQNITCSGGKRGGSPMFLADGYYNNRSDESLKYKRVWTATYYDPSGNKITTFTDEVFDNCGVLNNSFERVYGKGGAGGYPNGNSGFDGSATGSRNRAGSNGADSQLSSGGSYIWLNKNGTNTFGGNNAKGHGEDAKGYGSGGGSSGIYDANSDNVCWWGGNGGNGYCKFQFKA